jgi:hypothetical protein
MDCKIQVFKQENRSGNSGWVYRFAVIDSDKANYYPANFVCVLPLKLYREKANEGSVFGNLFGVGSVDFATGLLTKALKTERDNEVKLEIEKRLKIINPALGNFKCSQCKKTYLSRKARKYRRHLCDECLNKRGLKTAKERPLL